MENGTGAWSDNHHIQRATRKATNMNAAVPNIMPINRSSNMDHVSTAHRSGVSAFLTRIIF